MRFKTITRILGLERGLGGDSNLEGGLIKSGAN